MTKKQRRRLFTQTKISFDVNSAADIEKFRYLMSLDSFFDQYEEFLKRFIERHGLPTDDPVRLILHKMTPQSMSAFEKAGFDVSGDDKNLREEAWSDELVAATDSLFYLNSSRKYIHEEKYRDAVFDLIRLTECLQKWLVLRFEDDIVLGQDRRNASAKGGKLSSVAKRQKGREDKERLVEHAKNILASGRKRSDTVNILAVRFHKTPGRIRQVLREVGL